MNMDLTNGEGYPDPTMSEACGNVMREERKNMSRITETHTVTGNVRLVYPCVWEPWAYRDGEAKYYSCIVLIPKCDEETVGKIRRSVDLAILEGLDRFGGTVPPKSALRLPLRDGDTESGDPAFRNCWFLRAKSRTAPEIVDREVRKIHDRNEIYSGCRARVGLTFRAYSTPDGKGVTCILGNIQKTGDGEPIGGRVRAADDFGAKEEKIG